MKRIIIWGLCLLLSVSCSNFLGEYSQDMTRVKGLTDLDEVLLGDAYMQPGKKTFANSYYTIDQPYFLCLHMMSDELSMYETSGYGDPGFFTMENMFGWYTWQAQVGLTQEGTSYNREDAEWNELYERIAVVNMVLESIGEQSVSNEKEERTRNRITGEAQFLRGLYYFTLVNMYAAPYQKTTAANEPGVPLKLTGPIEDRDYFRTPVAEVYEQILEDLHAAHDNLANADVKNHPYRADVSAADLLLSRVYLYMQDWKNAYEWADKVLERRPDLTDLHAYTEGSNFLNRNQSEIIFSMGGHLLSASIEGYVGIPVCTISSDLAEAYDSYDLRMTKGAFILEETIEDWAGITDAYVFNKVRNWQSGTPCDVSDCFLFRTAEAYLNKAEAAAFLDKEGEAKDLLYKLRSHRVDDDNTGLYGDGAYLMEFIRAERQRELCLEGHRWFDLRRYTVAERYPYTKEIKHAYVKFNQGEFEQKWVYTLGENDAAYTLAIPREVLMQQNSMGTHIRPNRIGEQYKEDFAAKGAEDGRSDGEMAAFYALEDEMDIEEGLEEYSAEMWLEMYHENLLGNSEYVESYIAAYEEAFRLMYEMMSDY